MRYDNARTNLLTSCLVAVLLLAAHTGNAHSADGHRLVFFGDSLSDSRNYYFDTRQFTVRPFPLIPDDPYLIGGLRFSNGKVWAEYLARSLNSTASGKPSLAWPGVFTNYAVGRSRARADLFVPPDVWNLTEQVDLFLEDFEEGLPEDALYVFWIGANDLRDALEAGLADPSGATSFTIIGEAIEATIANVLELHAFGARRFLILNMPNIANLPAVQLAAADLGVPELIETATQLSAGYNIALADALMDLETELGDTIEIQKFDIFWLFEALVADPASFGFSNVTDPCLVPDVRFDAICEDPEGYVFWDGIHPTTSLHEFLADRVRQALAAP